MTTLLRNALVLVVLLCSQIASAQSHTDGMAAMQLEDWDKAISIYSALSKANATDQPALLTLGNAYMAKGDKDKAKETFKAAFAAKPEGAFALIANGRVAMLENDPTTTSKQFEKAAREGKKNITALRLIGESYLFYIPGGSKKPDLTSATEKLKVAVDYNAKDFASLMSLGYAYKINGNGGLAAQNYEYAQVLEPKNPLAALMLAKVYRAGKQPDKALEYMDKALSINPKYTAALRYKADHLYFARKWEMARDAYRELLANGGSEVTLDDEMQMANMLFITKDYKGCSELVEKIIAKDDSKTYLRRLLAYCSYETGDYTRGKTVIDEYFMKVTPDKILPTDYEYRANLTVKTKGDTSAAIEDYRKTIMLDSSKWSLYKTMSDLQYTRKSFGPSLMSYKSYVDSLEKPAAMDYYQMGSRQYFMKEDVDSVRYTKAAEYFAKVTEMMPDAGIGWWWRAKSLRKLDVSPDAIAVDPSLANKYGKAQESLEKWIPIGEKDKVKNQKDLLDSYQYLAYCYFVKLDKPKFDAITAKWLEMEADPTKAQVIKDMQAAYGQDQSAPVAPGTPATPATGGGKG